MVDQKQKDMLHNNVQAWNKWRKVHPEIRPDLIEANLNKANLSEANLSEAYLSKADLNGTDLSGADLSKAYLSKAYLIGAYLIGAYLNKTNLSGAYLCNAILNGTDLCNATLKEANLSEANLSEANLSEANLIGADLRGANLSRANLCVANLCKADLRGADLRGANLSRADLSRADLSGANLSGANLSKTTFSEVNLSGADLSGVNLIGAELNRVDLSRANLSEATIAWTTFGECDLQLVKGLSTIDHQGPSHVSINTIYKSKGNIPEIFLRGTGADESFITYMHALTIKPIKYYTCFISYSSKDQEFAERLYTDLQVRNVRCWYAPEDMKIGDQIRQRIDDSIHVYDKLLLILSSDSVISQWVETEVETALEKERRGKRVTLFPVRIDEMVMHAMTPWASYLRNTRHIGDFTQWKDYDAYQRGLQRLLRDLKQGE